MKRPRRAAILVVVLFLVLGLVVASAEAAAKRRKPRRRTPMPPAWTTAAQWSAVRAPKAGAPRVFGFYTAGCVQGAVALPDAGTGFETMHRGRRRYFGHPTLVDYVRDLAAAAAASGFPALLVGDLGQARGGPTPSDHGSHQSGLDVDLAYGRPVAALWTPLPAGEREGLHPPAVVDIAATTRTAAWGEWIPGLLELAAEDPRVDRIFVNALVKREACAASPGAPWLGRLRPWWGHDEHFHVRLRCPPGSPGCRAQEPPPPGDGCEEAESWIGREKEPPVRQPPRPQRRAALPAECRQVLR